MRCTFITAIAERVKSVFKNYIKLISSSSASRQYSALDYLVSLCIHHRDEIFPCSSRYLVVLKQKRGGRERLIRGPAAHNGECTEYRQPSSLGNYEEITIKQGSTESWLDEREKMTIFIAKCCCSSIVIFPRLQPRQSPLMMGLV